MNEALTNLLRRSGIRGYTADAGSAENRGLPPKPGARAPGRELSSLRDYKTEDTTIRTDDSRLVPNG